MVGLPVRVSANGLPAVLPRASGGAVQALQPDGQTPISVLREQLRFDLRAEDGRGPAEVTVVYWLKNGSPDPVTATVVFPAPVRYDRAASVPVPPESLPEVTLDGQPLAVSLVEEPVALEGEDLALQATWLDPYTGRPYSLGSSWKPAAPAFVRFQVTFGGGQQRDLAVRYRQEASWDRRSFIRPSLRYDYLLLPARHWAGFGELFIEVLAPTGRLVRSNLPLSRAGTLRMEGGQPVDVPVYQAHLTGLPDSNLSLFLAPAPGGAWFFWSWWWGRPDRAWLLAALALLAGFGGGWLRRDRSRKRRVTAGWMLQAALVIAMPFLIRENLFDPNPFGYAATWFVFLPATWGLVLAGSALPGSALTRWVWR